MLISDDFKKKCRFYRLKTSKIRYICLYLKTLTLQKYYTKSVSSPRVFNIFHRRFLQWLGKTENLHLKILNFNKIRFTVYLGVFKP